MTPEARPEAAYVTRLHAVRERLSDHVSRRHSGTTAADPKTGETWDEGQVWAHLAEFIDYWIPQARQVIAGEHDVPFGRTKSSPDRIAAIAADRSTPPALLWERLETAMDRLEAFLRELPAAAWAATGMHPTLGTMDLARITDEFLVGHLEEHAEQLDSLVS